MQVLNWFKVIMESGAFADYEVICYLDSKKVFIYSNGLIPMTGGWFDGRRRPHMLSTQ